MCKDSEQKADLRLINMTKEELIDKVLELQKEKRNEEKFLLNITHDLRTPLNVILSAIQCYYVGKENKSINMIKRNCYKMLKLINNLIDTTKLSNNYYNLDLSNIDIISLIEGNIELIDKYAKYKNVSLIFDTNIEECIMAVDSYCIDRIITNLLSNAIKFSHDNGIVYINTFKNKNTITISIKDNGIGIPKNEQKDIFNRYIQSSKNKNNEYEGSGIGLELVKNLIEAHDGSISLVSEENEGSEFTIKLPIKLLKENIKEDKKISNKKVEILEMEFSDIYL